MGVEWTSNGILMFFYDLPIVQCSKPISVLWASSLISLLCVGFSFIDNRNNRSSLLVCLSGACFSIFTSPICILYMNVFEYMRAVVCVCACVCLACFLSMCLYLLRLVCGFS